MLSNWPLAPSSLSQFFWADGSSPHINQWSTSLMTQPLTCYTNLATMESGRSSQSSSMPWLLIAFTSIPTLVLLLQFPPLLTTLPLHLQAQLKCSIFKVPLSSPYLSHWLQPYWSMSSNFGRSEPGHCTPLSSLTKVRLLPMLSILVQHMEFVMDPT